MRGSAIRAVGDGGRRFVLSFSSEEPYERIFGVEILDHGEGAVDLSRLNEIGVLLFNHDVNFVVGRILRAWVENRRGCAEVEFDTDEQSELIYRKVAGGTLKGVSVRYTVETWEEVAAGKTSQDGFAGPCSIARKWTPLEVSIVSVPADATVGVGRDMGADGAPEAGTPAPEPSAPGEEGSGARSLGAYEKQVQANRNYIILRREVFNTWK